MSGRFLRSLLAAAVLYVAYFGIGVLLDIVTYATIGLRPYYAVDFIWKSLVDAAQILVAIATMKLFFKHYDSRYVLAMFTASLVATLAIIYAGTPETAGIAKAPGIGQAIVAICIALLMSVKGRL